MPAAQEAGLELYTNIWCSIRRTHKPIKTWFKSLRETTKYQISQLPAAQEVGLEIYV